MTQSCSHIRDLSFEPTTTSNRTPISDLVGYPMGNKISTATPSTASAGIDSYVSELGDIQYERSIGSARFMKTIRGLHKDSLVIVKIFVKPEQGLSLQRYLQRLEDEREKLSGMPNVFPWQRMLETDKAAYLVRQFFYGSLYDRISTRPFLTLIEKKWIAYQLLHGLADAHSKEIYHGDIKTENIQVTSWNWAFLVDFASFKPTYLPEDNPADFSFFFDTSSRRTCYVAPERFYKAGTEIDQHMKQLNWDEDICELTPAMDIFSLGCVIAEMFLEGTSIFSLSQLFKYKSGDYSPNEQLEKIEDVDIRNLVKHMIQLDPNERFTAEKYLHKWRGKAFPNYFYTFLYQYISSVSDSHDSAHDAAPKANIFNLPSPLANASDLADADKKIERIYKDFDKIAFFLNAQDDDVNQDNARAQPGERRRTLSSLESTTASTILLPPTLNIPNYDSNNTEKYARIPRNQAYDDGALIFLTTICSLIRNTVYPRSKLMALDILLALSEHLTDDVKLDRLVPYVIALLTDETALVRANALKTLTQVLCMVESISPINASIFPEYIIPNVQPFATDKEVLVRTTYATCIALLAETAIRFQEMTQVLINDGTFTTADVESNDLDIESIYDSSMAELKSILQEQIATLLIDPESAVKRALLINITCLCLFFGRQKANDVLLSHMITYLNDKDWMLRSAFLESIKGIGTFVGGRSLEEYILPLMMQALTDAEEFVIENVLTTLTSLSDLGLFQKMKLWELVGIIAPLTCHPNIWIRYGAIGFIASTSKHLPQTDIWCIIYPLLTPFLISDVAELNELGLLENIRPPLPRQIYDQALIWASKATSKSLFWKIGRKKRTSVSAASSKLEIRGPGTLIRQGSLFNSFMPSEKITKSEEDEKFLERLRSIGMTLEDEDKLIHMREYIFKVSGAKMSRPKVLDDLQTQNGEMYLKNLGITPITVFLRDISSEASKEQLGEGKAAEEPRVSLESNATTRRTVSDYGIQDSPTKNLVVNNNGKRKSASSTHINTMEQDEPFAKLKGLPIQLQHDNGHNSPLPSPVESNYPSSLSSSIGELDLETGKRIRRSRSRALIAPSTSYEGTKAFAETSTITMNVTGRLGDKGNQDEPDTPDNVMAVTNSDTVDEDGPSYDPLNARPINDSIIQAFQASNQPLEPSVTHSEYLHELFLKIASEAFPPNMPEIKGDGKMRPRGRRIPQGMSVFRSLSNWKPEGTLVAHLAEHIAAINQIIISWDHTFFASCSDDGSVRIWDCSRLERNVTNRSRSTFNEQGGRIKCMCFIQNTYSIASASDNGSIYVFRVDFRFGGSAPKYGKCVTVRKYQLVDEHAVVIKHFDTNASNTMAGSKSLLVFATTKGNIYALDLRTMEVVWKLKNRTNYGVITSMITDQKHTWLLVGTMKGVLTLYDIRFCIPLRSWLHPSRSPISVLLQHPDPKWEGKRVVISAGRNEVTVWDILTIQCVEIFGVKYGDEKLTAIALEAYKKLDPPADSDTLRNASSSHEANLADNSIKSVIIPSDSHMMLTGGSDRKIRFWDMNRVENSTVVLGLDPEEPRPRYSSNTIENIKFHLEFAHVKRGSASRSPFNSRNSPSNNTSNPNSVAQHQNMMRNHMDAITSMVMTELPYPMIISGDRDGVIKVFA
ncbi:hypothetical protein BGW37DRAFT_79383 [Umbelopsis sp. PMI_123]|nr:hypothetical protein BGW37DRAFT_79383 [Umbelopsis sp. PMI_123]